MYEPLQACPHCPEYPERSALDEHVASVHGDIPACTASLDSEYQNGILNCAFRVGHRSEDYGDWHASTPQGLAGRTVWNDSSRGATPHRP
jgi:hypothetical protein